MAFVYDHSENFGPRRRRLGPRPKRKTFTQYLREAMEAERKKNEKAKNV